MSHPHEKSMIEAIEMVTSFNRAIIDCGGAGDYESYKGMTLEQIVLMLAPNHVRFIYQKKDK